METLDFGFQSRYSPTKLKLLIENLDFGFESSLPKLKICMEDFTPSPHKNMKQLLMVKLNTPDLLSPTPFAKRIETSYVELRPSPNSTERLVLRMWRLRRKLDGCHLAFQLNIILNKHFIDFCDEKI